MVKAVKRRSVRFGQRSVSQKTKARRKRSRRRSSEHMALAMAVHAVERAEGNSYFALLHCLHVIRHIGNLGQLKLHRIYRRLRVDVSHNGVSDTESAGTGPSSFVTDLPEFRHIFIRQTVGSVDRATVVNIRRIWI